MRNTILFRWWCHIIPISFGQIFIIPFRAPKLTILKFKLHSFRKRFRARLFKMSIPYNNCNSNALRCSIFILSRILIN